MKKSLDYLYHVVSAFEESEEVPIGVQFQLLIQDFLAQIKVDTLVANIVSDKQLISQDDNGCHESSQAALFIVYFCQITNSRILWDHKSSTIMKGFIFQQVTWA